MSKKKLFKLRLKRCFAFKLTFTQIAMSQIGIKKCLIVVLHFAKPNSRQEFIYFYVIL